jgi:farnesyl-diphosphate farnesyltransferase
VWCEHHYPSFVSIPSSSSASQVYDEKDLRAKVVVMDQKRDAELKLGVNGHGNGHRNGKGGAANARALTSSRENEVPWQMMLIGISAFGVLIILVGGIVWGILVVFGEGVNLF